MHLLIHRNRIERNLVGKYARDKNIFISELVKIFPCQFFSRVIPGNILSHISRKLDQGNNALNSLFRPYKSTKYYRRNMYAMRKYTIRIPSMQIRCKDGTFFSIIPHQPENILTCFYTFCDRRFFMIISE